MVSEFLNKNVAYFLKVASTGSFKEAARLLNLSQPALSIAIKKFEDDIGTTLFIREKRNAELTVKGRELFAKLSMIEKFVANETAAILDRPAIERLRIGSIPWFAERRLLPTLRTANYEPKFHHDQYFIRPAGIIREAVEQGHLDFAFINWPTVHHGVASRFICEDPAVIGGLKRNFKQIANARSYKDLENEPWIFGESRGANWTDSIPWDKTGFVCSEVYTVKFLIMGGYGIYEFQLAYYSPQEQKQLVFTKFPGRYSKNSIYAIWKPGLKTEASSVLQALIEDFTAAPSKP